MDIALMSTVLSQGQLHQQASISVMKKSMDQVKGNADFINRMMGDQNIKDMQHAAQPYLGGNIDIKG